MIKFFFSTICILTWITIQQVPAPVPLKLTAPLTDSPAFVLVKVYPAVPLIEKDHIGQYLNFDLTLNNTSNHILELSAVELSVNNEKGNLIERKFLNQNGLSPSITLLGNTVLNPGETINIFNPFFEFPPGMPLSHLKFRFYFSHVHYRYERGRKNRYLKAYPLILTTTYYSRGISQA